ncbi:hypothetical protein [Spirillospora sp. NPDC047279]|uniref:hypothetical protein n=1 Tax=Spirillospora sp. NPDC047279 TaxID=3155478 RepID=UPI00340FC80E
MNGFGRLVRSEWTKLRSVPRWMITLGAAIGLTAVVALLTTAGSQSVGDGGGGGGGAGAKPPRGHQDGGTFAYRELTGDGSLVTRIASQKADESWAKAGLMIRAGSEPGARYAAVMLTPGHGVRMQADFDDKASGDGTWLKLTRTGTTVTGYSSTDGADWRRLGTYRLGGTAHLGLFVATPATTKVVRQFGGESIDSLPSRTQAVFDRVEPRPEGWRVRGGVPAPPGEPPGDEAFTWDGARATLTGSGDVGPDLYDDDLTRMTLTGILLGLICVVGVTVLFVTSEYRRGMAGTTFTVTPHRGRVLAARTLVLGGVTFLAGAMAAVLSLVLARPFVRESQRGDLALTDPVVLRAVLGTALLAGLVAVFSMAVATLFRNTAAAVTVVLVALLVPRIVATGLPLEASRWLTRLTPAAGFEVQQTFQRYDSAMGPWAGLAVLTLYAVVGLALAARFLTRRDA